MENYSDYIKEVFKEKDVVDENCCKADMLVKTIALDLSISKNDEQQIKESLTSIANVIAQIVHLHTKEDENLLNELTQIWWSPQFAITNPKGEIEIMKQYVQQLYGLLTNNKPSNHQLLCRQTITHINTSLVSIALTSGMNPTQILYDSVGW